MVQQLDHPGFHIVGKKGLQLLVQALFRGLQQEPFPIQNIFQTWNNTEGQVSVQASLMSVAIKMFLGSRLAQENIDFGEHGQSLLS